MNVGVYCSSSDRIAQVFFEVAEDAGQRLAAGGHTLVYGGGNVGLMGALARSVHRHGGQVVGVIPEALKAREGVAYDVADELITTRTMQQRKALIFTRADAFLALPGGPGTLEEFMEVLTLRQLGYHHKPIALVNTGGFYEPLLTLLGHYVRQGFARESLLRLFHASPDPAGALEHVTRQANSG
ncbi:MAG: TIGR00730 family Rossman fold protein [Rhodothermales bacterium]|nr:TIGR00730 family Rossman fold protein [Rhodothermales bacterium]